MANKSCRIWWDPTVSAYRISAPYNKNFVGAIKTLVPASDRAFDNVTKFWTFTEAYFGPIIELAAHVWSSSEIDIKTRKEVEAHHQQTRHAISGTATPIEGMMIEFVRLMPFEAMAVAYKKAAVQMHPDRGGDAVQMARLNKTWTRLKKEHYQQ